MDFFQLVILASITRVITRYIWTIRHSRYQKGICIFNKEVIISTNKIGQHWPPSPSTVPRTLIRVGKIGLKYHRLKWPNDESIKNNINYFEKDDKIIYNVLRTRG